MDKKLKSLSPIGFFIGFVTGMVIGLGIGNVWIGLGLGVGVGLLIAPTFKDKKILDKTKQRFYLLALVAGFIFIIGAIALALLSI